jgi:hypothetical protein
MRKRFWIYLLIFVFTFSFSVGSDRASNQDRKDYFIYQIVPGKIFILYARLENIEMGFTTGYKSTIPAFIEGLKEISRAHMIKNIVPVNAMYSHASITDGLIVFVGPRPQK